MTTEPKEIYELFGKRVGEIKPGLDRVQKAWELLGKPSLSTKTVLVAGTNGKGTTGGILWHLLASQKLNVGHFSSPHLIEFRERISVSKTVITNTLICKHLLSIKETLPRSVWDTLSFFEINTLLALHIFEHLKTDINVIEVGLGGRLDSTNILSPYLSIITSIGLDHTEFLGNSTKQIAREKAGIMRPHQTCLWGGLLSSDVEADEQIKVCALSLKTPLEVFGDDFDLVPTEHVRIQNEVFALPKMVQHWPVYLQRNFTMALAAFTKLLPLKVNENRAIVDNALSQFGTAILPWPITLTGRFQLTLAKKDKIQVYILFDVCHNVQGAKAFSSALSQCGFANSTHRRPAFISILKDKDASGIWKVLKDQISATHLFKIESERTWTSDQISVPGKMYDSFLTSFKEALNSPDWDNNEFSPWLVFGSVAGVGEAIRSLKENGWDLKRQN